MLLEGRLKTLALFVIVALSFAAMADASSVKQWNHEWAKGAVFYEVFVRSFQDSNGDGIGDINGLISRLDYLQDLGIDALWLMPIFKSPSYHGYDTSDYMTVARDYGTNRDFTRLMKEAHKRNIRVIVDFVMNHTSSEHPWFIQSMSSPTSKKHEWYVWSKTNPGWKQPWGDSPVWHEKNGSWYYGIFWSGMPDLNFNNTQVRAEIKRIAKHWLKAGVDGFRLDATRYLVENGPGDGQCDTQGTHEFLKELSSLVRDVKPSAVLVGENWVSSASLLAHYFGSVATVAGGDEIPMNFNFPLAEALVSSVQESNGKAIVNALTQMKQHYPSGINDAPFLTNHDQVRVATVFKNDPRKLRTAAALLLTLPGAPFIYYGEEIGMENGTTSNDEAKRTPMAWDATPGAGFTLGKPWFPFAPGKETSNVAAQINNASSLFVHYRELIAARRKSDALKKGVLTVLSPLNSSAPYVAWTSTLGPERVLVVHNLSDQSTTIRGLQVAGKTMEQLWADKGVVKPRLSTEGWEVTLPAGASGVWRAE